MGLLIAPFLVNVEETTAREWGDETPNSTDADSHVPEAVADSGDQNATKKMKAAGGESSVSNPPEAEIISNDDGNSEEFEQKNPALGSDPASVGASRRQMQDEKKVSKSKNEKSADNLREGERPHHQE